MMRVDCPRENRQKNRQEPWGRLLAPVWRRGRWEEGRRRRCRSVAEQHPKREGHAGEGRAGQRQRRTPGREHGRHRYGAAGRRSRHRPGAARPTGPGPRRPARKGRPSHPPSPGRPSAAPANSAAPGRTWTRRGRRRGSGPSQLLPFEGVPSVWENFPHTGEPVKYRMCSPLLMDGLGAKSRREGEGLCPSTPPRAGPWNPGLS